VTHFWSWRRGDGCPHPEGRACYAGLPRPDMEWDLAADGEILIRGREPGVISSGYQTAGGLLPLIGDDGWFHTGDAGRRDEAGRLIFVERLAESIRVKGEYVPMAYVEGLLAGIEGLEEVALWRRAGELVDHEVVLYAVAGGPLPRDQLRQQIGTLPPFMRPAAVLRIRSLPRTAGVGKVSRRELEGMEMLEVFDL
jgi:crotonobetaine/carnitine-CoA ligase